MDFCAQDFVFFRVLRRGKRHRREIHDRDESLVDEALPVQSLAAGSLGGGEACVDGFVADAKHLDHAYCFAEVEEAQIVVAQTHGAHLDEDACCGA